MIESYSIPTIVRPKKDEINRQLRLVKKRLTDSDTILMVSWDVYNNTIRIYRLSEGTHLTGGLRARSITWTVDIDDNLDETVVNSFDEIAKVLIERDLIGNIDIYKEDKLLALIDGAQNMNFEDFFPLTSWPKDVYDRYYDTFKLL